MLHFRKILFCIVLLCFYSYTQGQEKCVRTFSGQVLDENNLPLVGVSVVFQTGRNMITDNEGKFHFDNLCTETYQVSIHYLGYKKLDLTIMIQRDVIQIIRLQPELKTLDMVTIKDKPAHVEETQTYVTLTEKQLAETAGKSLGETLKEIPGVNSIQSGPGIFKPVIHGVHSQRVLILNYGIRQEGQQWGAEHAPEIDPFIASNIVVIKDASAIKYGTDALGGVVVVNPPELPEKAGLGGSLNSVLQSNGRSGTLSGMLEGGIKEKDGWGWRLQGTAKRSGDFNTPGYVLTNTGIKELDFSAATGYHDKRQGAEIFFSHFQSELGILKGTAIGNLADLDSAMKRPKPQYTTGFSYSIGEPHQEVNHNLLKINGHVTTDKGEWKLQYGFQTDKRKEFDLRLGENLTKTPQLDLQLNTHTLEGEWASTPDKKISGSTGITAMLQDNNNVYGTKRVPFIPNFNNTSGGVFGIVKMDLDRWKLDVGVRYDYRYYHVAGYNSSNIFYTSDLSFQNVSGTVGASVDLNDHHKINSSISMAWRPPSVAELYSTGTHQSAAAIEYGLLVRDSSKILALKSVDFKNEQAAKWVVTHSYTTDRFQLETTVYANYIFNYIYLQPRGITKNIRGAYPYFRYTQTDALFVGADLLGTWHVSSHWKVIPKMSLIRASDETNHDYLVFIPTNKYDVTVRYEEPARLALKNFFVETKWKYTDRQHRAPRVITPDRFREAEFNNEDPLDGSNANFDFMAPPEGYWLLNVAAGFSVPAKKIRYDFRIAGENLLNTTYREYTNRFRYYANELGTNITLSVKCIF